MQQFVHRWFKIKTPVSLPLEATPMGLLLSWLGAKQAEEQAATTKRNK